MDQKPVYYDGSGQLNFTTENQSSEPFQITEEMRKNLGHNPYYFNHS